MKKVWLFTKTMFWLAIIVASVFIIFTTLNIGGYQMFIVKSGSMEPKIKTGSVVVDKKASTYSLGNVITFKTSQNSTVTHRVYKIESKNGANTYITKGDANNSPDPNKVKSQNVVGKVLFSIPFLGYLIAFIRTLPGLLIFIIVPAIIIIAEEISTIKTEAQKMRDKRHKAKTETIKDEVYTKPVYEKPEPKESRYKIGQDREHIQ